MKIVDIENPVRLEWFSDQGFRLDASPYLSGALEARKRLEALSNTVRLDSVTTGYKGGVFNGPKFSRVYLEDPEQSVPFLGSTDMLEADFSYVPRLSKQIANRLGYLKVEPGMSLISCSGTIGRMAYARPDMTGFWTSQHVMKVQADSDVIPSGYLYTFLRSRFGIPMIVSSAYGAIIQHIEPHHLADLPVPRFDSALEQKIHDLVEESARLRAAFQSGLVAATEDFFQAVGLPELIDYRWHDEESDLGFVVQDVTPASLRALNFRPRAQRLINLLRSVPGTTLGQVCDGGTLRTGARFKRIDADEEHGVRLVGQRQAFWVNPEGRWISAAAAPRDIIQKDETILVSAHGTFGENEVYARSVFITGSLLRNAYSQDFVRVLSGTPEVPGAYLFALFRSNAMFRIFRSISVGGKQQEYHTKFLRDLPIPLAAESDRRCIANTVRQAYRDRDHAETLEFEALSLLTDAIEGAEG
ncbi:restriction endonuclease subunit S [Pseudarthrobacter phenanthrenivorans]|uniref:methylation-associated defense system restriction endonuclease subunit S MAD5 n=1 Tax=Pseudarthrobacter phenanthrenivorans TaxID=361575 RepID=UPI001128248F|nr:restriction endonuclease subunit S [Pseudarthrobacter phenanthrenivorans]TPV48581.1 restriction endonuclease subunit S [Pseudarthrobacter phenanthrenivorans]